MVRVIRERSVLTHTLPSGQTQRTAAHLTSASRLRVSGLRAQPRPEKRFDAMRSPNLSCLLGGACAERGGASSSPARPWTKLGPQTYGRLVLAPTCSGCGEADVTPAWRMKIATTVSNYKQALSRNGIG